MDFFATSLYVRLMIRSYITAARTVALAGFFICLIGHGQSIQQAHEPEPQASGGAVLQGIVRDSLNHPIAGATVYLQSKDAQIFTEHTDSAGTYRFSAVRKGIYTLSAEMPSYGRVTSDPQVLGSKNKTVDLILESAKTSDSKESASPQPEFFDEPHFRVAGVTDTTSLGGHGSDAVVRNREALAHATAALAKQLPESSALIPANTSTEKSLRETAARQPEDFDANSRLGELLVHEGKPREAQSYLEKASRLNPRDVNNSYELALAYAATGDYSQARSDVQTLLAHEKSSQQNAELHHLLADADEKLGDPLEAVREYQRASELSPSESNLFDWGAELLTHHAAEPAIEVFRKGNHLFPRSLRMLVGLGAAWYSLGSYDQAAQRFCEASDLNPDDPNPYLFMGRMQAAESTQSDEIKERLARFLKIQPQNPWANYYYAMSLQKDWKSPEEIKAEHVEEVKSLLQTTIHLDPHLGLAYLQLGILYSQQKDFPHAISAWQQAIAATPDLEQAHYRLAQLYRELGETSKAHSELQLYEEISKKEAQDVERQRHNLQQFVYQLRDPMPASQQPQ